MATYYLPLNGNDDANTIAAFQSDIFDPITLMVDTYIYNTVYGLGGDDVLTTTLGATQVLLYGGDGNDQITGGSGADFLYGDNYDTVNLKATGTGNDTIHGAAGDDTIYAAGGNDTIFGENDNDEIFAGAGRDKVVGGAGTDTIFGRSGDDKLTGGLGIDHFVFGRGDGRDVIKDFVTDGAEHDVIGLLADVDISGFKDLIRNHAEDHKGNVILSLGGGTEVVIEDTHVRELSRDDFSFHLVL